MFGIVEKPSDSGEKEIATATFGPDYHGTADECRKFAENN